MDLVILDRGEERRLSIERVRGGYVIEVDGRRFEVDHCRAGGRLSSLVIDGGQFELSVQPEANGRYRVMGSAGEEVVDVLDPLTHLARTGGESLGGGGVRAVTAYMPGRVVAVLVEEGAPVRAGQGVVVLEAMKMENEIQSEVDGVVARIHVSPGQSVEGGDLLFEMGD